MKLITLISNRLSHLGIDRLPEPVMASIEAEILQLAIRLLKRRLTTNSVAKHLVSSLSKQGSKGALAPLASSVFERPEDASQNT